MAAKHPEPPIRRMGGFLDSFTPISIFMQGRAPLPKTTPMEGQIDLSAHDIEVSRRPSPKVENRLPQVDSYFCSLLFPPHDLRFPLARSHSRASQDSPLLADMIPICPETSDRESAHDPERAAISPGPGGVDPVQRRRTESSSASSSPPPERASQPPRLWPGDRHPCSTLPEDNTTPRATLSTWSARTMPAIRDGRERSTTTDSAAQDSVPPRHDGRSSYHLRSAAGARSRARETASSCASSDDAGPGQPRRYVAAVFDEPRSDASQEGDVNELADDDMIDYDAPPPWYHDDSPGDGDDFLENHPPSYETHQSEYVAVGPKRSSNVWCFTPHG